MFIGRTRKGWPFNTDDCLIEVTAWAGVTMYIRGIHFSSVSTIVLLEFRMVLTFYSILLITTHFFSGDKIVFMSTDFSWQQTEEATVLDCPSCGPKQIRVDCKLCIISTVGWKQVCINYNKYLVQMKLFNNYELVPGYYIIIPVNLWMSDCCLTPTQQFFSYIMARTS